MHDLKEIVRPFYDNCLTVSQGGEPATLMNRLLADSFQSHGSADSKGKPQLIGQVGFFWKLIPNLRWEIQEMLQDGDKVVVRSIASGSPRGDFMGLPTDGSKSFRIMTIDIHTVRDGQIQQVHHIEDWATAMKQLRG